MKNQLCTNMEKNYTSFHFKRWTPIKETADRWIKRLKSGGFSTRKFEHHTTIFYRFTGITTYAGCWMNTRKVCKSIATIQFVIVVTGAMNDRFLTSQGSRSISVISQGSNLSIGVKSISTKPNTFRWSLGNIEISRYTWILNSSGLASCVALTFFKFCRIFAKPQRAVWR